MNFEQILSSYLDKLPDSKVTQAMRYSLMANGKRIRPMLLFDVLNGYGINEERGLPFACALEMIHTYSLIHDDLPAMDNDDFRRGKPTCHKQFDEATAILAGDGLLTYAFEVLCDNDFSFQQTSKCVAILSSLAGPNGMVYGQCLDTQENQATTYDDVIKIQEYKTGCLLSAPLMMAATLADQSSGTIEKWHQVGNQIGLAFQIQDDILDVTKSANDLGKSNSDIQNGKVTTVSLLGLEQAKEKMNMLYSQGEKTIYAFDNFCAERIVHRIEEIRNRQK